VTHQVLHRDLTTRRFEHQPPLAAALLHFDAHLQLFQLRQVCGHWVHQLQLAFFGQHQGRHHGDRLGHRRDAKDRVGAHGAVRGPILKTEGLLVHDLAFASDQHHCAGDIAAGNVGVERVGHSLQTLRGEADCFGFRCFGQRCRQSRVTERQQRHRNYETNEFLHALVSQTMPVA
jgi:hypothetical protein